MGQQYESGQAVADFLGSLKGQPDLVTNALSASLLRQRHWWDRHENGFIAQEANLVGNEINAKRLQADVPGIDAGNVLKVAATVNTPTLWDKILPPRLDTADNRYLPLLDAYHIERAAGGDRRMLLVDKLAGTGGQSLLASTTEAFFMAALAGDKIDAYAQRDTRHTKFANNPIFKAVLLAAHQFHGPAQTPEQLLSRLRQLFPATDQTSPTPSAFRILESSGNLQMLHLAGSNDSSTDIAAFLGVMYQSLGQVMASDAFQEHFMKTVSRQPHPRWSRLH